MYVILRSGERQSLAMEEEELELRGIQNSSNSHPKFAVSSNIVICNRINSESLTNR